MSKLPNSNSWKHLQSLVASIKAKVDTNHIVSFDNITLNYRRQYLSPSIINALFELAEYQDLKNQITCLSQGNLPYPDISFHTACRAPADSKVYYQGKNILPQVMATRERMYEITKDIREGRWLGYSGKPITDIVHLGIGGSILGPSFCLEVLADFISTNQNFYFISEVAPNIFEHTIKDLSPETTLFIVASKSFQTSEVLCNMNKAIAWIKPRKGFENHFIAVTANPDKARSYKFRHILDIGNWISGRFSTTSAINLITCIAIGAENFDKFLHGAYSLDQHFFKTSFEHNLPVLLALIGVWNNNFRNIHNHLILAYGQHLEKFVNFVQQLEMESNGKSVDLNQQVVEYATAPIVWGGSGDQAQHSYYQLIAQGTHQISMDLILDESYNQEMTNMVFFSLKESFNQSEDPLSYTFNQIILKECNPTSVGELIALYEHKVFCQSVIWGINPFNQPGVEQCKRYLKTISEKHGC